MRQGAGALIDRYGRHGRTPLMTAIAAGGTVLLVGTRCVAAEVKPLGGAIRAPDRSVIAAGRAYPLSRLRHRDHTDRLLIGRAVTLGCPLVSDDDCVGEFATRYRALCAVASRSDAGQSSTARTPKIWAIAYVRSGRFNV